MAKTRTDVIIKGEALHNALLAKSREITNLNTQITNAVASVAAAIAAGDEVSIAAYLKQWKDQV